MNNMSKYLTGAQKVAIFLMSLQNKTLVSQIMNALTPEEIHTILRAMSEAGITDTGRVEKTLLNFLHDFKGLTMATGPVYAEAFIKDIFQNYPEKLNEALDKLKDLNTTDIWNALSNLDDGNLLQFIRNEHPQTSAIILSKISSMKTARILNLLQPEYAQEVITRMLSLKQVKQETLTSIEAVLHAQLENPVSTFYSTDNINKIANIFNHFNEETESSIKILKEYDIYFN